MGVIYYKLDYQTYGYPGDSTKGCSLTGNEIDSNFNFLRGYDIDGLKYDDEDHTVTLKRLNGEELVTPLNIDLDGYKFEFDPKGILIVTYPSGAVVKIDGFAPSSYGLYTGSGLTGDGSVENPLDLSPAEKTGTYKPVIGEFRTLPKFPGKGARFLTYEPVDFYGRLYTFDEVQEINNDLANSAWRVPTKEDWDKMLNSVEICDEDRTHDKPGSGFYYGKNAGDFLKSKSDVWKDSGCGKNDYGFSVLPVGRYAAEGGYEENSYGRSTYFWTSEEAQGESSEIYIKAFTAKHDDVFQNTIARTNLCSLRLVKDCAYDTFNQVENILGTNVQCVQMAKSKQVWTKRNIGITKVRSKKEDIGVRPEVWDADVKHKNKLFVYYINEFDGNGWIKRQMDEGDSVVIAKRYSDNEEVFWHEWRAVIDRDPSSINYGNYILVDTLKIIKDELQPLFDNFQEQLDLEKKTREEEDAKLDEKITAVKADLAAETERATAAEKELADDVKKLQDTKVDKDVFSDSGRAMIFNEADGGGAKFEHADGSETFVGVNDGGENGLMAQIYADKRDGSKWVGSRLNVYNKGIFYQNIEDTRNDIAKDDSALEIAVKRDVEAEKARAEAVEAEIKENVERLDESLNTEIERAKEAEQKLTDDLAAEVTRATEAEALKTDKVIVSETGTARIFNEVDGGGAKFEHRDGSEAFVGVNNGGKDGLMVQIYADVKNPNANAVWSGSRINVYNKGIFYQSKYDTDSGKERDDAELEIAVKRDINDFNDKVEAERQRAMAAEQVLTNDLAAEISRSTTTDEELKAKDAELANKIDGKVDKVLNGPNGIANIFNEADGGGIMFLHKKKDEPEYTDSKSFVGVNDGGEGADGITAQIYSLKRNGLDWEGTRLNVYQDGIYYQSHNDNYGPKKSEELELAVKRDVETEKTRAVEVETDLDERLKRIEEYEDTALAEEIERAKTEEKRIEDKVDAEVERAIAAEKGLKIVSVEPGPGYASAYELHDIDDQKLGATINILKDQHLQEVKFGKFHWIDDDGNEHNEKALRFKFAITTEPWTVFVYIPVNDFFSGEFTDGLEVVDGKIKVKVDVSSDEYLSVSQNGVKVKGITDGFKTLKGGDLVEGYETLHKIGHALNDTIKPGIDTISGNTTALRSDLNQEINRAKAAEENNTELIRQEVQDRKDAIESLNASVDGASLDDVITIHIDEVGGLITNVDVNANDVASKAILEQEIIDRQTQAGDFDNRINNLDREVSRITSKEEYWNNKQEKLIDGETIKTVNGQSLLGAGNIVTNTYRGGQYIEIVNEVISVTGLTDQIRTIESDILNIDRKIDNVESSLQREINDVNNNLTRELNNLETRINNEISTFENTVTTSIRNLETKVEGDINTFKTEVNSKISTFETEVEGDINTFKTEVNSKFTDVSNQITEIKNEIIEIGTDTYTKEEIDDMLEDLKAELTIDVNRTF